MTRPAPHLATPAAVLVLSGCGVAAAVTARTNTVVEVIPQDRRDLRGHRCALSLGRRCPSRQRDPAGTNPVQAPPPGRAPSWSSPLTAPALMSWLEILSHTGAVVARTEINPTLGWMVAAGPGGAYWTQGGTEYVLTPTGAVHRLGAVAAERERRPHQPGRHGVRVRDRGYIGKRCRDQQDRAWSGRVAPR